MISIFNPGFDTAKDTALFSSSESLSGNLVISVDSEPKFVTVNAGTGWVGVGGGILGVTGVVGVGGGILGVTCVMG